MKKEDSIKKKERVSGIIQITRKGTGYLRWTEGKEDVEVITSDLSGALNGDTVEVEINDLIPRPKGKVVKIISRAKEEFVCTLRQAQGKREFMAIPDDVRFYRPINVGKSNYDEGEKVLVR